MPPAAVVVHIEYIGKFLISEKQIPINSHLRWKESVNSLSTVHSLVIC